jgi:hypothetical protein
MPPGCRTVTPDATLADRLALQGEGVMPRQDSWANSASASALGTCRPPVSQKAAIPRPRMARLRARPAPAQPGVGDGSCDASMHPRSTCSNCSRTAGSLRDPTEDQPERLAFMIDSRSTPEMAPATRPVVGAGRHGGPHPSDDRVAVGVQQRQVEFELPGKC